MDYALVAIIGIAVLTVAVLFYGLFKLSEE